MAYFGRTPKKPGSVPGSQSGGAEVRRIERAAGVVRQVERGRQQRPSRASRTMRAGRTGRKAR